MSSSSLGDLDPRTLPEGSVREAQLDAINGLVARRSQVLAAYIRYGGRLTSAPFVYHYACGLGVIAATIPQSLVVRYAGSLPANVFLMLVGPSGDFKTSATKFARDVLSAGLPKRLGRNPGSPEGLKRAVLDRPIQLLEFGEFGDFLASAHRPHFEGVKTTLNDIYDGRAPEAEMARSTRTGTASETRVSILAGCAPSFLEDFTDRRDWEGGFMGRWLFFHGEKSRDYALPDYTNETDFGLLVEYVKALASWKQAGPCLGFDAPAVTLWTDWYVALRDVDLPAIVGGLRARAPALAIKAALLFSWDAGIVPRDGSPWRLPAEAVEFGIRIVHFHLQSIRAVAGRFRESRVAKERHAIVRALEESRRPMSLSEIALRAQVDERDCARHCALMYRMGMLIRSSGQIDEFCYDLTR